MPAASVRSVTIERVIRRSACSIDTVVAVSTGRGRTEYKVDLTACFVFSIRSTLEGSRGLSRDEIEALIEANWLWVSLDTEVLLESHWELESVEEHAMPDESP